MLRDLLPFLLGHVALSIIAISTAAQPSNGPDLSKLAFGNLTRTPSQLKLQELPTFNQSANDLQTVPKEFSIRFEQDRTRVITEKSTYMTALSAMIALSQESFHAYYPGGEFVLKDFADVKIVIWSANSPTDTLQIRYALYGLHNAIYSMSLNDAWFEGWIVLYWSGSGTKVRVGYIRIMQWPEVGIEGLNGSLHEKNTTQGPRTMPSPPNLPVSTQVFKYDIGPVKPPENTQLSIDLVFGEEDLTLQEIFLTFFAALAVIAEHGTAAIVQPFNVIEPDIDAEFEYHDVVPPRTTAPFFEYGYAARSLGLVTEAMFEEGKFQEVEFTVQVDGVAVGMGFLITRSLKPATTVDEKRM